MPVNNAICIFSRAIRTGKTTQLQQWISGRNGVAGILTPDENGMRKLLDIATGHTYDLQVADDFAGQKITVGRFTFDESVMAHARRVLTDTCTQHPNWLVIDEVGKLEIEQDTGLEPAVTAVVRHYLSGAARGRLLLVVRDSLLAAAIEKYGLHGAVVYADLLPER